MGLCFLATIAGKKTALRNLAEPILESLVFPLREVPDDLCLGVSPANAASCLALTKPDISGTRANIVIAVVELIPGIVYKFS